MESRTTPLSLIVQKVQELKVLIDNSDPEHLQDIKSLVEGLLPKNEYLSRLKTRNEKYKTIYGQDSQARVKTILVEEMSQIMADNNIQAFYRSLPNKITKNTSKGGINFDLGKFWLEVEIDEKYQQFAEKVELLEREQIYLRKDQNVILLRYGIQELKAAVNDCEEWDRKIARDILRFADLLKNNEDFQRTIWQTKIWPHLIVVYYGHEFKNPQVKYHKQLLGDVPTILLHESLQETCHIFDYDYPNIKSILQPPKTFIKKRVPLEY